MDNAVTPERKHRRIPGGYSLIEMLVVMFVIGIMSSVIMLTINFDDPNAADANLDDQILRLLTLSDYAEDQAVLSGEPIGLLLIAPDEEPIWQYNWQRYRGGQWVAAEEPLTGTSLPRNVEVTLEVDGEPVDFPRIKATDEPPLPSIVFYPGGEVTPFIMTLFDAASVDEQIYITSQRLGVVEQLTELEALETL